MPVVEHRPEVNGRNDILLILNISLREEFRRRLSVSVQQRPEFAFHAFSLVVW